MLLLSSAYTAAAIGSAACYIFVVLDCSFELVPSNIGIIQRANERKM